MAVTLNVFVDASYGLEAVLLQMQQIKIWKPMEYALRALSKMEQQYAQIEKEALAWTWA